MPLRDPDDRWLAAARSGDAEPDDDTDDLTIRRLGAIARSLTDDDVALEGPPPSVWTGIAAIVDAEDGIDGDGDDRGDDGGGAAFLGLPLAPLPAPPGPPSRPPGPPPVPIELARARSAGAPSAGARSARARSAGTRRPRWPAAVAAAAVLVAGVLVALEGTGGDATDEVVATAVLTPLQPGAATSSPVSAALVEADGRARLDVAIDTGRLPGEAGYYEMWLVDTAVDGMVSLGPVHEDGTYDVPAGVDPGLFPIVDVSAEPVDGDPTHSGTSVLRGTLARTAGRPEPFIAPAGR